MFCSVHNYIQIKNSLNCKGPCTLSPKFSYALFSYLSSFPIKMITTDAKMQKIHFSKVTFFFMTDESFGGSV